MHMLKAGAKESHLSALPTKIIAETEEKYKDNNNISLIRLKNSVIQRGMSTERI